MRSKKGGAEDRGGRRSKEGAKKVQQVQRRCRCKCKKDLQRLFSRDAEVQRRRCRGGEVQRRCRGGAAGARFCSGDSEEMLWASRGAQRWCRCSCRSCASAEVVQQR